MRLLCDVSRHSHIALPGHLLLLVLYVMDFNSCEELLEVLRSMVCGFVPPPGVLCSWLVPAPWEVHQPSRNTSWIAVLTSGPWVINSPFWSVGWIWGHGHGAGREHSFVFSPELCPAHRDCWGQDRVVSPAPRAAPALGTPWGPELYPGLCEQGDVRHGLP